MRLTPREIEKLMVVVAGDVARRRRERGVKLNHPEAIAYITAELLEGARDGRTVEDLMDAGAQILTEDDVMPGVSSLISSIQVETTFPDGTKLITVNQPIRPGPGQGADEGVKPGELVIHDEPIMINEGRDTVEVDVTNVGDRPVQVGSHYHFAEVNDALEFERERTVGFHLDIPAGTSARFEPGDARTVRLVAYGGTREVFGFRGDHNRAITDASS